MLGHEIIRFKFHNVPHVYKHSSPSEFSIIRNQHSSQSSSSTTQTTLQATFASRIKMAFSHIAIIGAGLSGLALSLALHKQGIKCTIYESRPASLDIGGAIMLSPNALRILDAIDIYKTIKPLGYSFKKLHFYTETPLDTYDFGDSKKYDYDALRIYRYELIDALVKAVQERGIPIEYGKGLHT